MMSSVGVGTDVAAGSQVNPSSGILDSLVLGTRQKHSLNAFIARKDWIQEKITILEASTLPEVDTLEETESVALQDLWRQHDEIEREADALDKGELRSLRLLAKAATQKHLLKEDTDLIDITFQVLESIDKLLRLLRTRNKALQLLELRVKWNGQVKQVERDYAALIDDNLPRFLKKARWTKPVEPARPRLSNGFASGSPSSSPMSSRTSTNTSLTSTTYMARQMRSEILSLDLASLTSSLHSLQYATLASSGITLDAMIDTSTVPDRLIDLQEDLEARVKAGLAGLGDFCSALVKQWREADEIWWASSEEMAHLDMLERDTKEANLKMPSHELASEFEDRLKTSSDVFSRLQDRLLPGLSRPFHPIRVPDQHRATGTLLDSLQAHLRQAMTRLASAKETTRIYRTAVEALQAAQAYQRSLSSGITDLRLAVSGVHRTILDGSSLKGERRPGAGEGEEDITSLSRVVSHCDQELLPQAGRILTDLQEAGIDPNVRKDVQSCVLSLAKEVKEAKSTLASEEEARTLLQNSTELSLAFVAQQEDANALVSGLTQAIHAALWTVDKTRTSQSILSTYEDFKSRHRRLSQAYVALSVRLETLSALLAPKSDTSLSKSLAELQAASANCLHDVRSHLDLLKALAEQRIAIEDVEKTSSRLKNDIAALGRDIASSAFTSAALGLMRNRLQDLHNDISRFSTSLAPGVPFLSSPTYPATFGLLGNDQHLRDHLNTTTVHLSAALEHNKQALGSLEQANTLQIATNRLSQALDDTQSHLSEAFQTDHGVSDVYHALLLTKRTDLMSISAGLTNITRMIPTTQFNEQAFSALTRQRSILQNTSSGLLRSMDDAISQLEAGMSAAAAEEVERKRREEAAVIEAEERKNLEAYWLGQEREAEELLRIIESSTQGVQQQRQKLDERIWTGDPEETTELASRRHDLPSLHLKAVELRERSTSFVSRLNGRPDPPGDTSRRESLASRIAASAASHDQHLFMYENQIAASQAEVSKPIVRRQQEAELEVSGKSLEAILQTISGHTTQIEGIHRRLSEGKTLSDLVGIQADSQQLISIQSLYQPLTQITAELQSCIHADSSYLSKCRQELSKAQTMYEDSLRSQHALEAAISNRLADIEAATSESRYADESMISNDETSSDETKPDTSTTPGSRGPNLPSDIPAEIPVDFTTAWQDTLAGVQDVLSAVTELREMTESSSSVSEPTAAGLAAGFAERVKATIVNIETLQRAAHAQPNASPLRRDLAGEALGMTTPEESMESALAALETALNWLESLQALSPAAASRNILSSAASATPQETVPDSHVASAIDSLDALPSEEDVFGPGLPTSAHSRSTTGSSVPGIPSLQPFQAMEVTSNDCKRDVQPKFLCLLDDAIDDLDVECFIARKGTSPSRPSLPTLEQAEAAQRQVSLIHAQLEDIEPTFTEIPSSLNTLQAKLRRKTQDVMHIMQLATFASMASKTDAALSDLLDVIDQGEEKGHQHLYALAEDAIAKTREAAIGLLDDQRISYKTQQLDQTWQELRSLAMGESALSPPVSRSVSRSSSMASNMSSAAGKRRVFSDHDSKMVNGRSITSSTLSPRLRNSASLSRIPVASPRARSPSIALLSETKPASRLPQPSATRNAFRAPASRKALVPAPRPAATPSMQRTVSSISTRSSGSGGRRSSTRRVSSSAQLDENERPNTYRADPKRKLDVAVGRIVNNMNVPVNITPAETFRDESGKYWIGSPEPKLYFARILRSKTVMIRVGGGWQELGSFLSTHFNHLFILPTPRTSPARSLKQHTPSDNLKWLSSASVRSSMEGSHQTGPLTSRAVSYDQRYELLRKSTTDLTSLLVKSTSRSPPVHVENRKSRSISAHSPWKF